MPQNCSTANACNTSLASVREYYVQRGHFTTTANSKPDILHAPCHSVQTNTRQKAGFPFHVLQCVMSFQLGLLNAVQGRAA